MTIRTLRAQGSVSQAAAGGYKGWAYDAAIATASAAVVSGRLNVTRVVIDVPGAVNTIYVGVNTAGSGATAGQCAGVLYDATGAQIGITGDVGSQLSSAALAALTLSSGVAVSVGQVLYVGVLWNGTTAPVLMRTGINVATGGVGSGLSANQRFGVLTGPYTAPPGSITPTGLSSATGPFWMAVA